MTLMTLISDDDIKSCQESTSNVHSNDSMTMVELQGDDCVEYDCMELKDDNEVGKMFFIFS
ncbi:hypothetical protein AAZX31_13G109500 [Glycine max]